MIGSSPRLTDLARLVHREIVLVAVLSAMAAGGFLLTRWAAADNREQQVLDAAAWFARGRAALSAGQAAAAVQAFERAVARRPDDWSTVSALAEAMAADGELAAARRVLLRWRQRRPDDPAVSIQLARLEAGSGDVDAAVGYYESALHGRWSEPGTISRLDLRRELIQFQLRQGQTAAALAQTLILAANAPDDAAAHIDVGRLFLAAGDPARALDRFARALRLDPPSVEARIDGVKAAYALGDYPRVLSYARGVSDAGTRERARVAALVVASDPLEPRLAFGERVRRVTTLAEYAARQLDTCRQRSAVATPLAERTAQALADALAGFSAGLSPARLRESSDVLERGVRLSGQALAIVSTRCPPIDARGEAIVRVARRHGVTE